MTGETLLKVLQVFCEALLTALDIIEAKYERGVVITTSGIQKFYSNGLDLEHASRTPGFYANTLYKLWRRLLMYVSPFRISSSYAQFLLYVSPFTVSPPLQSRLWAETRQ